jgi:hypothetical protein
MKAAEFLIVLFLLAAHSMRAQVQDVSKLGKDPTSSSPTLQQWSSQNLTASSLSSDFSTAAAMSSAAAEATASLATSTATMTAEVASSTLAAGSGNLGGIVSAIKGLERTQIYSRLKSANDWIQTHIVQSNLAQNTIKTVNIANQTKNMIGMMGATMDNLKDVSVRAFNDATSKSSYTGLIVNEATEYLGFSSALAGFNGQPTPYRPIFNFLDSYESSTSRFRDKRGTFSITQGILSTVSDQELLNHMGTTTIHLNNIQQTNALVNDMEVRLLLKKALNLERQARWLNLQINLELYGRSAFNLRKDFKALGDGLKKNQLTVAQQTTMDELMSGSTNGASANSGSKMHTDTEILAAVDAMNDCMAEAQNCRNQAREKMNLVMRLQMTPANLEAAQIRRLKFARDKTTRGAQRRYDASRQKSTFGGAEFNYSGEIQNQNTWQNN